MGNNSQCVNVGILSWIFHTNKTSSIPKAYLSLLPVQRKQKPKKKTQKQKKNKGTKKSTNMIGALLTFSVS